MEPTQATRTSCCRTPGARGTKYPPIGPPQLSPATAPAAQPRSRGPQLSREGQGGGRKTPHRRALERLCPRPLPCSEEDGARPSAASVLRGRSPLLKGKLLSCDHRGSPLPLNNMRQARPASEGSPGRRNAELPLQPGRASQSGGQFLDGQAMPPVSAHQKKGIWRAIAKDVRTLGVYGRRSTHCQKRWEDLRRWERKTAEAQLGMAFQ
ncbi:hypothetical protein NDU88_000251 [Pleurodeles waltl]|uniref:Myb/SANT-like DNA-binding domain-containing protein n=1 Tax=Pleurodeles waltl TaxID=8319 RepID=A0AAV7VSX9_PLEWA|nr:hypothetical protein NDU88_000251 [Pleurodeles waltl]